MKKGAHKLPWKRALGVGAGLLLFVLLLDTVLMPWYTRQRVSVRVPAVVGLAVQDALQKLKAYGLRAELIEVRYDPDFPRDHVLNQAPAPGSEVKPGRRIYLTVNSGEVPMATVPNLKGVSLRNARLQIENYGLSVGEITYVNSPFRNTVIDQSPPPLSRVPRGSPVNLVVSSGLGDSTVVVPNVVGLELTEATQVLQGAGLRVGLISFEEQPDAPANRVIRQLPPAGESLLEGAEVNLIVSRPRAGAERDGR
ncbi:MAG: PASTA domain-containing protein [Bacteroidetes bacterium]|nr:PASTA domain-containing protein [Rhodothermia bacterium]MCS7155110.1 PASTA domain-containing protein [Bacteroidota bacterium]MCX7907216.1 PASTA domain-containing protein [Bacteroidota bacterium]MDW8138713.1 PASTA domain-containing protein [Bacteroidota bacterium]MDW8286048.1 PASTA domain-containing protein [Bacteroidota bacterium]